MNRENKLLKITSFTFLITMIAVVLLSGTYAKYSSSASGTSSTVVANWSFKVNNQDITILGDDEEIEFGLFETILDSDGQEEADVAEGLIAPGTSGSFEFALENSSDVTTKYAINLESSNQNIPIEFSFTGEDNSWTTNLTNLVEADIMERGETKNVTVQWRWAFDGATDIELGEQKINVTASITATQLNNTEEVIMLNGDGQTYYTLAPTALSFRSSANINDFQEVQVNGETIDPSNYTMTEGSTIINLSIDYLKTLEENDYSISIVSKTGSPKAGFSVVEPDVNNRGFYYNQPYTAYVEQFNDKITFFMREDGSADMLVGTSLAEVFNYTNDNNNITFNTSYGNFTGNVSTDGTEIYCNELAVNFVIGDESIVADEEFIYVYDSSLGGYVVKPIDKTQESYAPIRTGINGYPTVKLYNHAFEYNTNLTAVPIIPDSVTSIGNYAFRGCTNLNSISLPSSITSIGDYAFNGCTNMVSITIPSEVTIIKLRAFGDCTSLKSVTIPASVTRIGNGVFHGCTSLTKITYEGYMEQWNAIDKPENLPSDVAENEWNYNVPATTVECKDGTVTL